jgi:hypothetical protein
MQRCESAGLPRLLPAQDRANAQRQLAGAERLGDVVVGPELEPDDAIDLLRAGGQHDDRQTGELAIGPNPPADLLPRQVRQHQVQHQQIGRRVLEQAQCGVAGRGGLHLVPGPGQVDADELEDVGLVIYHEDSLAHR